MEQNKGRGVEDQTSLLFDNGAGYISRAFGDYFKLVGMKHILASPFHPQTSGMIERYHQTLKGEMDQIPCGMLLVLSEAVDEFIKYYNHGHYHKALSSVTLPMPIKAVVSR